MTQISENEKLFQERERRVMDAVALKKPDRVPIVSISDFFYPTFQGLSCKEAMYDYEKMAEAWKKTQKELDWDMSGQYLAILPGKVMDILGIKTFSWPGAAEPEYRLADRLIYQYREREFMMADEVDEFLKDPSDFTIRKLLPRLATALEPIETMPASPVSLSTGYSLITGLPLIGSLFAGIGHKIVEASEEFLRWQAAQQQLGNDLKEMGYPVVHVCWMICPFDWIADTFRGMKGTMLDMYRQPDRLLAVVEFMEPILIEATALMASMSPNNRVFIPLHKGAAGFMSDEQFKKFYWPQLKRFFMALIDRGLVPMPFYEGDYTPRLKYLAELPPGEIMGHYDKIDRKKHKEILKDVACFWGDIPPGLLVGGTPDQVRDYVKELIDEFPDGGLIIDGAANGIPVEAKKENVMAMTETVFEK